MVFGGASHSWKKAPDLREECKHRRLAHKGTKCNPICRLSQADEEPKTPEGEALDLERRLKFQQKKRKFAIIPFQKFGKIPIGLRNRIWEYSLPGPRTLCPGRQKCKTAGNVWEQDITVCIFQKNHHTPNPAALSVCREYGKLRCGVTGRVSGRQMSMRT